MQLRADGLLPGLESQPAPVLRAKLIFRAKEKTPLKTTFKTPVENVGRGLSHRRSWQETSRLSLTLAPFHRNFKR